MEASSRYRASFTLILQLTQDRRSFTLIELLVVIALVGALSAAVIVTLNPVELLRQARDSNRLSELQTLEKALALAEFDGLSLGNASTTYLSLADPAATSTSGTDCSGVGLPDPPSGWAWHCAASSTLRKVDGTGWLPVNFSQMSSGSPLPPCRWIPRIPLPPGSTIPTPRAAAGN